MSSLVLNAKNISARRGPRLVLQPCNVSISSGEVVGIYGPNGAGKSTLLQVLAGLLIPESGLLRFKGKHISEIGASARSSSSADKQQPVMPLIQFHRQSATVFQEPLLLKGSVTKNITLGLRLRKVPANIRDQRAAHWMDRLNISHLGDRESGQLSGGEARRVSLARALVLEPELFFFDEPFAGLDTPTRLKLISELKEILEETGTPAFFVTHDLPEARELCHRLLVLNEGHVLQNGPLDEVIESPISARVSEILGLTPSNRSRTA